ncbi:MAG: 3-hydroxyacyl-CoA dehydrogenase NAD-binding domain-containing protein, partial [Thermoanaerobaculia bacterium]
MIQQLTILGTGTMGRGIAYLSAVAGYETVLFDADPAALAAVASPAAAATPLFDVYKKYVAAIDKGDLGGAKQLVSSGKREE